MVHAMKKFVGKLVKMTFRDMEPIVGMVVTYSDDWMLLRNVAGDYLIDGFVIVRNRT